MPAAALRLNACSRACVGRIVYQGPRDDILPFFTALALRPLPRQGTADFLQEVVSKRDQPVRPLAHAPVHAALCSCLQA